MTFVLKAPFSPQGDQPKAIKQILASYSKSSRQVLLGATGTGKTFTMAHVVQNLNKPTLVLCHNKTLAAQLWSELQTFFPKNAVEYFISYYDYYQPESYIPSRDLYIEKDMSINEKIERMRLSAIYSLSTRSDVIVVSSVSCIFGLGDPSEFNKMTLKISVGDKIDRKTIISHLISLQYKRNDLELKSGRFRVRGDTIDLVPGYSENIIRISLFDDEVESITEHHHIDLKKTNNFDSIKIFPSHNFVVSDTKKQKAITTIQEELDGILPDLEPIESHRINQRTKFDLEMIQEVGTCKGIENYSRHFDGRSPGQPPYTLLDYFGDDFLMIIDESHVTLPQVHGMYKGDKSRKKNLIDYGFRLPSAYDNRPLTYQEFDKKLKKVLYVSATPGDYELEISDNVVEQIIRPTGLLDPVVEVRSSENQVIDLVNESKKVINDGFKVLVTTLTKRMAEHLTDYLGQKGLRVRYLHSEIETIERTEIIRQLRANEFDVLVGINLLREGLSGLTPKQIMEIDPDFLEDAKIVKALSASRENAAIDSFEYMQRKTKKFLA